MKKAKGDKIRYCVRIVVTKKHDVEGTFLMNKNFDHYTTHDTTHVQMCNMLRKYEKFKKTSKFI